MTLELRDENYYGDDAADLHAELKRYAEQNGYDVDNIADCQCECGSRSFELLVDELQGVGGRVCSECGNEHVMADGGHYVDEAELVGCECLCGNKKLELSVGISRYRNDSAELTDDVRWFYIGCRCPECRLLGCYADWKNEYNGFQELLDNI